MTDRITISREAAEAVLASLCFDNWKHSDEPTKAAIEDELAAALSQPQQDACRCEGHGYIVEYKCPSCPERQDDGWVKVDGEHPLPKTLSPTDWVAFEIRRAAFHVDVNDVRAYRRSSGKE